jgi:DNA polymerase kappa
MYEKYKSEMTTDRTWFHIDMDMFFAACEIRDRPEI